MFYHVHLANGRVIVHSHPFKANKNNNSPFQSHNHSASGYNLIQQLNETSLDETPANITVEATDKIISAISIRNFSPFINSKVQSLAQLRAPPGYSFFPVF